MSPEILENTQTNEILLYGIDSQSKQIGVPGRFSSLLRQMYEREIVLTIGQAEAEQSCYPSNPGRILPSPIVIRDPISFTANVYSLYQSIAENSVIPQSDWYVFRRLPSGIEPHYTDIKQALENYDSAADFFSRLTQGTPSGVREAPELWVQMLLGSLEIPNPTIFNETQYQKLAYDHKANISVVGQFTLPSYQWDVLQDSPYEMRLGLISNNEGANTDDNVSFIDRLPNVHFLPIGKDSVLLFAAQVPEFVPAGERFGKSERELGQELFEFTQTGYNVYNLLFNTSEIKDILGEKFVNKYEFKSKPVSYMLQFAEELNLVKDKLEHSSKNLNPATAFSGVKSDVERLTQLLDEAKLIEDNESLKYAQDYLAQVNNAINTVQDIEDIDAYIDANLYMLRFNWIHDYIEKAQKISSQTIEDIRSTQLHATQKCNYFMVLHGIKVLETALKDDQTPCLQSLWQYEHRRERMRDLNRPYRGSGSPATRIAISTFVQRMSKLGYGNLVIFSEKK